MIVRIQYLRGIAALMVVYHHVAFQVVRSSGITLPLADIGAAGVDIFFVISGFIMWVTTQDSPPAPGVFIRRRIIRITPLYWVMTLMLTFVSLALPDLLNTTRFQVEHVVLSMLYIPTEHPEIAGQILPFFIQGWTLNYEIFFYLIFACLLTLNLTVRFLALAFILGSLAVFGALLPTGSSIIEFYTSTIILEFLYGVVLGSLFMSKKLRSGRAPLGLLLGGAALLLLTGLIDVKYGANGQAASRAFIWGLPAAAIVAGAAFGSAELKQRWHQLSMALGDSSYSLYLSHIFALPVIGLLWRHSGLGFSGPAACAMGLVMLIGAIAGGYLVYILIERPLAAMLRWPGPPTTRSRALAALYQAGGK
jgi:exopolysaccharide production protein ExoZ